MARKKLRYLLFDFPGDHEIDYSMSTECETVHALLIKESIIQPDMGEDGCIKWEYQKPDICPTGIRSNLAEE